MPYIPHENGCEVTRLLLWLGGLSRIARRLFRQELITPVGARAFALARFAFRIRTAMSSALDASHCLTLCDSYRDKITKLTPRELVYVQSVDDPGVEVHLTKRSSEPPTDVLKG